MIKCNVRYSKARVAFSDLPIGSVFRKEDGGSIYLKVSPETIEGSTTCVAVNLTEAKMCFFAKQTLVEELYNVELLYDTIP